MFFPKLSFIILAWGCVSSYSTLDFRNLLDQSTIIFSLSHYDVFSPNGESIESFYSISPNTVSRILVTDVPSEVRFVVVQVHSYLANITLGYDQTTLLNNSITGTNIGLLKTNQKKDISFYLKYNTSSVNASVMVAIQAYGNNAPMPGGCNMEFQVEVSPFLHTSYNDAVTQVDFAPAAPPLSVLSPWLLTSNNECNIKPSPVEHVMYHQYFPERDFSKETYFKILKSMMTKGRIVENAKMVPEKPTGSLVRRIFASYTGTGNAFVVMSNFENQTSVYVPSVTFSCNNLEDEACGLLDTPSSKILCAIFLLLGLFACFFGHVFYTAGIAFLGFLSSSLITHFVLSFFFTSTVSFSASIALGFFLVVTQVLLRNFFGHPIVSLTIATLSFGFLLASVLFYAITDYVDIFVMDVNYWGVFIGIVTACPFLMVFLAEKANIISCGVLGSYVVVAAIDYYIGSNLRYIVINTIRRATVESFNLAIIGPPFQMKDIILCTVWLILLSLGIMLQRLLTKCKPPYPPLSGRFQYTRVFSRLNETSPLLPSSTHWAGSYGV